MSGPDFIIIGAMKCATSTLYTLLARQPGVFMTTPKEPNFFSDDEVYAKGIAWYHGLFAPGADARIRGEASTHYTKLPTHPHTIERIRAHARDAKFIYVMRDPIQRLVSHYIHDWSEGKIDEPLERALEAHPELIDYGRYAMQLRPYLATFGPERVLPVFFERLHGETRSELERVCAFLGCPPPAGDVDEAPRVNVSSERVRRGPLSAALEHPLLVKLRRTLVPRALRQRVADRFRMRERPQLSPGKRADLAEVFDRDLAELGGWLGVPLRCETFAQQVRERPLGWVDGARLRR